MDSRPSEASFQLAKRIAIALNRCLKARAIGCFYPGQPPRVPIALKDRKSLTYLS